MATQPVAGTSHHYVLEDTDGTKLGLLSSDKMASFRRDLIARTALKTSSGDTRYSDMEPPYATLMQDDFSGGRGQRNIVDDGTKFYDSENLDTRIKNHAFLGPQVNLVTTANVGMPEHNPGNISGTVPSYGYISYSAGTVSDIYYAVEHATATPPDIRVAQSFTTPGYSLGKVTSLAVYGYSHGGIANRTLTIELRSDNSNKPGTLLSSGTVTAENTAGWHTVTLGTAQTLSTSTKYWIVMRYSSGTGADYWLVEGSSYSGYTGGNVAYSRDGATTWSHMTGYDAWFIVYCAQVKVAQSFVFSGSGSYNVTHAMLYLKKSGTVGPTVRIETDSSGSPSGTLAHANATTTLDNADLLTDYSWVRADFATFALTKGTTYWLVVYEATQRSKTSYVTWGTDDAAGYSGGVGKSKVGSDSWTALSKDLYFRINSGQGLDDDCFKIFEYKRQLYAIAAPLEGSNPSSLWMNGDRGAADSNSGDKTKLVDATKSWTNDEWIGCLAFISGGPGKGEYRTITDNDGTTLTVSEAWETTHTTSTEYVILGSSKWTNVTPGSGDTIDAPVKDVLVANEIIYLAMGDSYYLWRYREYNNAGTWTKEGADDGTGHADLLLEHKGYIYRARATNQVSKAAVQAWGVNLTFDTAINVGTSDYAITALSVYDSEVWVGKEDSLWKIINGVAERIPINTEPLAAADNFRNMKWHNAYLYFPFGYGLERLYGYQVDDMGPNRDEGLLEERQGPVADLLPIPGTLYAAVDAGGAGMSSILAYNDLGWHELFRGTDAERIRCLHMQVIPDGPNRLWFGMGNDVCYAVQPARTVNPLKDSTYRFRASGSVVTSWIDNGKAAVVKYWKDLKVISDNLTATTTITAYYQLDNSDDDDAWTLIGDYDTSPYEEQAIGVGVTGRRIRFKFVLTTAASTTTPVLLAYTVDFLEKIGPKRKWDIRFDGRDYAELMNGERDTQTRADKFTQLDTWAASAEPLYLTTADPAMTGLWVIIDAPIELDKLLETAANGTGKVVVNQCQLTILEA